MIKEHIESNGDGANKLKDVFHKTEESILKRESDRNKLLKDELLKPIEHRDDVIEPLKVDSSEVKPAPIVKSMKNKEKVAAPLKISKMEAAFK